MENILRKDFKNSLVMRLIIDDELIRLAHFGAAPPGGHSAKQTHREVI